MNFVQRVDPEIYAAIENERRRQVEKIELIASENYTSAAVMEAVGSVLTNKYAEGYPGRRYYGGGERGDGAGNPAPEPAKAPLWSAHPHLQPPAPPPAHKAADAAAGEPRAAALGLAPRPGGPLS